MSVRNAFVKHLVDTHWHNMSDLDRTAATLDTERFINAPFKFPCGICRRFNGKSWYDFAAHVARHLEETSLAALSDGPFSIDKASAKRTEKLKSRHSKRSLQNHPRERGEPATSRRDEKQMKFLEQDVESDGSTPEDPDYVKVEFEAPDTPLPSTKKPHRGSLRPRKVREKNDRAKETREGDQGGGALELPSHSKITITGDNQFRVKFKDKGRHRSQRRNDSRPPNTKSARRQQSKQYPEEEIQQQNQSVGSPGPQYAAYNFQYERPNVVGQGYENYGYPGAVSSQPYYTDGYPFHGGAYNSRYAFQAPVSEEHVFSGPFAHCGCADCAMAMADNYD